ncbi:MAG: RNA-binding protein [Deltaproteobacteria bacterium]|jgi:RNA recognition motif-containing protein|nr:RNA-binding protein [Deltaproteobacteria bacterium]MBW2537206.1 RNA-binding protein [Deltaproteobacteria bacterium]
MSNRLYVGGLSWDTDDSGLREAFAPYGTLEDVKVICDRDTGRSRGFGFVTFASQEEAGKAITAMDGSVLDGRTLKVNEAHERNRNGGGGRGRF